MKLLVANAAVTLLLRPANAKPKIGGFNKSIGQACDYGTRFLQCDARDNLLCGSMVPRSFDEKDFFKDQEVK